MADALEPRDVESTRRWLESEADAARELVGRTRFPTPKPVALGEPGAGYPLPWSVQTWLPGVVATDEDPGESVAFARLQAHTGVGQFGGVGVPQLVRGDVERPPAGPEQAGCCGLTVRTDAEATISQHLAARALLDALLPEPDNGGASC